jgi:RNA polymerase sigma-70 factor (ECF subfamily)
MSRAPRTPRVHQVAPAEPLSSDSAVAAEVKALIQGGDRDQARERFAVLVASQQRRAVRIAYGYLRDAHDADEAVQDAFVKVFTHIATYREDLPFEVWFTRILVNACLDLRKARARRLRWVLPMDRGASPASAPPPAVEATSRSIEEELVSRARVREICSAVDTLPERQRAVFTLSHVAGLTTNEVSQTLGVSEATVRVHLFRAVRKLRRLLAR